MKERPSWQQTGRAVRALKELSVLLSGGSPESAVPGKFPRLEAHRLAELTDGHVYREDMRDILFRAHRRHPEDLEYLETLTYDAYDLSFRAYKLGHQLRHESLMTRHQAAKFFPGKFPLSAFDLMRYQAAPSDVTFPGYLLALQTENPYDRGWEPHRIPGVGRIYVEQIDGVAVDMITEMEARARQTCYPYSVRYKHMEEYLADILPVARAVRADTPEEALALLAKEDINGESFLVVPDTDYRFGGGGRWLIGTLSYGEAAVVEINVYGNLLVEDEDGKEFILRRYAKSDLIYRGKRLKYGTANATGKKVFIEWSDQA